MNSNTVANPLCQWVLCSSEIVRSRRMEKGVTPMANIQFLGIVKDVIMTSLTNLVHHKGFNNMAQAFGMAEDMFMKGMCKDASQGVLMITDGKPSFAYMTNEMVEQLDDKHGTDTGPYISKSWVVLAKQVMAKLETLGAVLSLVCFKLHCFDLPCVVVSRFCSCVCCFCLNFLSKSSESLEYSTNMMRGKLMQVELPEHVLQGGKAQSFWTSIPL